MLYKTIILELLQDRPRTHERLRKDRMLLPAVELYAEGLKASHEAWKNLLSWTRPGSDPGQLASEALEMALQELEASLPPASPPDEEGPVSLDEAMAFLHRHMPAE
jgi:hypothetical protein